MGTRTLLAAAVLLLGAGPASAQVSVQFNDGKVRLTANNAPVSQILAEWARVGGTKIVNGERVPGAPLTLQLEDVTEEQAIDTVLRGAAGYMVAAREADSTGASVFDRIMVLPTTTRVAATVAAPAPPVQMPQRFIEPVDDGLDEPEPRIPGGAPQPNRFPIGRGQQQANPFPTEPPDDEQDGPMPEPVPQSGQPGNPFGVIPGGTRPGTITPVVPRTPNPPNGAPQDQ